MKALLLNLSIGLSTSIEGSRFGLGIVSDFDLFHNMATDAKFNNASKVEKLGKVWGKMKGEFSTIERTDDADIVREMVTNLNTRLIVVISLNALQETFGEEEGD